jgi:integrase
MPRAQSTRLNARHPKQERSVDPVAIAEFAAAILADYEKAPYTTRAAMRKILSVLEDDLGVTMSTELERPGIVHRLEIFCAEAGFAESTRATLLMRLRTVIRRGLAKGLLHQSPDFPVIPEPRSLPRSVRSKPPARSDIERLRTHLSKASNTREGHRLHALVSLIVESGISLINALGSRVADVDLERGTIRDILRARGKKRLVPGGGVRLLRINASLKAILSGWIAECGSVWLFPGVTGVVPWQISGRVAVGVGRGPHPALRAACIAACIRPLTFEQLRRFHAENVEPMVLFAVDGDRESEPRSVAPPTEKADDQVELSHAGQERTEEAAVEPDDLVTLAQLAAMVHRHKRTLEGYKTKGELPAPAVDGGGGGKADLYDWRTARPWLERKFGMALPETYPGNRRNA